MNPFKVLDVKRDAGKKNIIAAAAAALKKRKFSALEIATAQKQLLNPETRADLEFLYFADPVLEPLQIALSFPAERVPRVEDMNRLDIFDERDD